MTERLRKCRLCHIKETRNQICEDCYQEYLNSENFNIGYEIKDSFDIFTCETYKKFAQKRRRVLEDLLIAIQYKIEYESQLRKDLEKAIKYWKGIYYYYSCILQILKGKPDKISEIYCSEEIKEKLCKNFFKCESCVSRESNKKIQCLPVKDIRGNKIEWEIIDESLLHIFL